MCMGNICRFGVVPRGSFTRFDRFFLCRGSSLSAGSIFVLRFLARLIEVRVGMGLTYSGCMQHPHICMHTQSCVSTQIAYSRVHEEVSTFIHSHNAGFEGGA
jgi:hypothetical protein